MRPALWFCSVWLVALAAILLLVGAFNAAMDPYLVIGAPRMAGINLRKEHFLDHVEMVKTFEIERYRPVTVLLGTSRVDVGLNPDDPLWPAAMRPVFNYGVDGAGLFTVLQNLLEAAATGRLKNAYVLLDFELFFLPDEKAQNEDTRRMLLLADGAPNSRRWLQRAHDLFLSTLTLGALEDNLGDLLSQGVQHPVDLSPAGYPTDGVFVAALRNNGAANMFIAKEESVSNEAARAAKSLAARGGRLANFDEVQEMVQFCRRKGIRLTLMLPPYDTGLLDIFERAGLDGAYAEWKDKLYDLAAQSNGVVDLWDFTAPSPYTTEPGPQPDERHFSSRYYWEYNHFKEDLGNLMIARMLGESDRHFGVLVKSGAR